MLPTDAVARVLVAVDLSPETEEALRCAEALRASRPTAIDVFYLWSGEASLQADAADRAITAIAGFARFHGAWDQLDRLDRLERSGAVRLPGWLTRVWSGGHSLAGIAGRERYDLVVLGLALAPHPSDRFELHRPVLRTLSSPSPCGAPVSAAAPDRPGAESVAPWVPAGRQGRGSPAAPAR